MEKRLRFSAPRDPVTLTLDGESFAAERGEPLAVALYGQGVRSWSRSPKFHRPRGPACFRGSCEGCLLRVDGVPNMMSCLVPAEDGQVLETQNTLGTRDIDLLQMADWLFPHGVNHHELFAGVPVLQNVMQSLARRVVGLGVLPRSERARARADSAPVPESVRRAVPMLVIGGGASGLAAATALARARRWDEPPVELVDEGPELGGSLRTLPSFLRQAFAAVEEAFAEQVQRGRIRVRLRTLAAAVFSEARAEGLGRTVLLVSEGRAELAQPEVLVLATGTHDMMPAFPGNDVPGVLPLRAAGILMSHGVRPGRKPLFLLEDRNDSGRAAAEELAQRSDGAIAFGTVERVHGTARVSGVSVESAGKVKKHDCDALIVCAKASPAYELALQCGAEVQHEPHGFVVRTDQSCAVVPKVFALGSLVGRAREPATYVLDASKIARAAVACLLPHA